MAPILLSYLIIYYPGTPILAFALYSQDNSTACGAFKEWSVILLTDKKKEDGFSRLLQAGGATVYPPVYVHNTGVD